MRNVDMDFGYTEVYPKYSKTNQQSFGEIVFLKISKSLNRRMENACRQILEIGAHPLGKGEGHPRYLKLSIDEGCRIISSYDRVIIEFN
jgi:hypothetical protein